ncbi:MAG: hypothetical protein ACYC33_09885 [Thermoleophilia bacterium]
MEAPFPNPVSGRGNRWIATTSALMLFAVTAALALVLTADVVAPDGPATADVVAAEGPVAGVAVPEQTELPQADRVLETDVFIWDTTAQGIGVLRAMQLARGLYGQGELVIASSSSQITAMSAQGLSVEDIYSQGTDNFTSGFWGRISAGDPEGV